MKCDCCFLVHYISVNAKRIKLQLFCLKFYSFVVLEFSLIIFSVHFFGIDLFFTIWNYKFFSSLKIPHQMTLWIYWKMSQNDAICDIFCPYNNFATADMVCLFYSEWQFRIWFFLIQNLVFVYLGTRLQLTDHPQGIRVVRFSQQ